jgi:hypothetical protein
VQPPLYPSSATLRFGPNDSLHVFTSVLLLERAEPERPQPPELKNNSVKAVTMPATTCLSGVSGPILELSSLPLACRLLNVSKVFVRPATCIHMTILVALQIATHEVHEAIADLDVRFLEGSAARVFSASP